MFATNTSLFHPAPAANAFEPGLLLRSREDVNAVFADYSKESTPFYTRVTRTETPLFIPVVLGALGPERVGERVAQVVLKNLAQLEGVDTTFVELPKLRAASPFANLENDETLSTICARADAMMLILPEYNYGTSSTLQEIFKTRFRSRSRKVLGICDLSPGWLGGLRVIQDLLPLMRQGRVLPLMWEASLAHELDWLNEVGQWREEKHRAPLEIFLEEVVALATCLRKERL